MKADGKYQKTRHRHIVGPKQKGPKNGAMNTAALYSRRSNFHASYDDTTDEDSQAFHSRGHPRRRPLGRRHAPRPASTISDAILQITPAGKEPGFYYVSTHRDDKGRLLGYRLVKLDALDKTETYDIDATFGHDPRHWQCDCADATYVDRPGGCKHVSRPSATPSKRRTS